MIIPLLHRVLVRPQSVEEANDTYKKMKELGLAIPETTDKKREEKAVELGVVISVGRTCFLSFGEENSVIVPGDIVYYAKYAGKSLKDTDGTEYLALNDEDIVALIKE